MFQLAVTAPSIVGTRTSRIIGWRWHSPSAHISLFLSRDAQIAVQGYSRSCILESLKSWRRTAYHYVITLATFLQFPKKIASENAENCRCRQHHYRLTPPVQGTSANIRIRRHIVESLTYISAADSMGLSSFIFCGWPRKRIFSAIKCVSAVQDHPKSLILAPIERVYATSY